MSKQQPAGSGQPSRKRWRGDTWPALGEGGQAGERPLSCAGHRIMPDQALDGIINLNKPVGMTSHDVVARARRISGQKKVGHAGTLDPMATGVLLLCLGQATRVAEYLMAGDKVYSARIRLGVSTDTYDAEGQVSAEAEVTATRSQVEQELSTFVGRLTQTPPMYSALKHEGTALYRLARQGQTVARTPRQVQIYSLELLEWAPPDLQVKVHCSKGTYIRSLAHDLGQRLRCGAHLAGLVRLACGSFGIEQAITVTEMERAFATGGGARLLQPLDAALQAFPAVNVDPVKAAAIAHGQRVDLPVDPTARLARAYSADGHLLALLRHDKLRLWQPHKVFVRWGQDESNP
jgi:tRNA pseudouridine55 synthase